MSRTEEIYQYQRCVFGIPVTRMIRYEPNVIWLVYEEIKCMERAMSVHSYTAPNLLRKKGAIMKGQIKKNLRTAD